MPNFTFTLWDVEHGLAIWIQTPAGHHHWIDAGRTGDFSPSKWVNEKYAVTKLDFLVLSHPDADHLNDLTQLVESLGKPRILLRNKSMPEDEKFKSATLGYQKTFRDLDIAYTSPVADSESPMNSTYNGGVLVKGEYNTYSESCTGNNTSVVAFYLYAGWLFVCPGDIEDSGWQELWKAKMAVFEPLITAANYRILVAPHHGRESGYSQHMMDNLKPHLALISDVAGQSPTDKSFREKPLGLTIDGEEKKYLSTKQKGRIQVRVAADGQCWIRQYGVD
jgi:competence protein ComEC